MTFNLIPEPRSLLVTDRPGISSLAFAGMTSFEIAKRMTAETGRESWGFSVAFRTVDEYLKMSGAGLPVGFDRTQGYCLAVREGEALVGADNGTARFYALQTLAQLLASASDVPALTVADWPRIPLRAFNLCYHVVSEYLPLLSSNMDLAVSLVEEYAHLKMNAVLVEFEGFFPYRKYPQLRNKQCFTDAEMERFRRACRDNHVTVIPLVQCLGHGYNALRRPEFAHLRELPETSQQFCACNADAREFVLDIANELIDYFGDVEYFHMGGDESRRLGLCPDCSQKVKDQGMGALYADHFNAIAARLAERGVMPMVWGDIMEDHPDILDMIDRRIAVIYWNYDMVDWNRPYVLEQYLNRGLTVFGAPAARFGAQNDYFFLYRKSLRTTSLLAGECVRHGLKGYIVTDWTKLAPAEPAIVGNVNGAACAWGEAIAQKELAARYSALYFGVRVEEMDRALCGIAEAAMKKKDMPNAYWAPPYCHMHVETLVDFLDRFDWSGRYFSLIIQFYTCQKESPGAVKLMREAVARAEDTLAILAGSEAAVSGHSRLYALYQLGALTQRVKCRMGLAFDSAVKLLKYPKPGDEPARLALAKELRALDAEFVSLAGRTWELTLPGTFEGSLKQAMKLKFDPEARRFMQGFAELLETGKALQGLQDLSVYEED